MARKDDQIQHGQPKTTNRRAIPTYSPPFETVELEDFRKVEVTRTDTGPDSTVALPLNQG